MTKDQILKQLSDYLPPVTISELRIVTEGTPGAITLCMTIADIIKNYNDTQDRENRVSSLLARLCKLHFNAVKAVLL